MAFPFLYEEGFELGTIGQFDAQSPDPFTRAGFDHYSTLAGRPDVKVAPFRGAYCFRVDLATNTTDHYVQETAAFDTAATGRIHIRFQLYISPSRVMADADEFAVFQLWSGATTVEAGVYVNFTTASGLRLGIGETTATQFLSLSPGVWHTVEVNALIDSGVPNDGTIDGFLDNAAFTQVTALDQGAITSAVFGVLSQDVGTTAGVVLIDEIFADDTRLFPIVERFPETMFMTRSGHCAVGATELLNVELIPGTGTDSVLTLYDTDKAYTSDPSNIIGRLHNLTASEPPIDLADVPVWSKRGVYVDLAGTAPRAIVHIGRSQGYRSDGRIRDHGSRRKNHPIAG